VVEEEQREEDESRARWAGFWPQKGKDMVRQVRECKCASHSLRSRDVFQHEETAGHTITALSAGRVISSTLTIPSTTSVGSPM